MDVAVVVLRQVWRPAPHSAARQVAPSAERAAKQPSPGETAIAPPVAALAPVEGPPASPADAGLAAALRRGPFGCANQGAAWMSQADRDACRERLAAGAASVPHLQGMAPAKLAYYAAVVQAEEDWRSGRNAGHLPYFACTPGRPPPPHALKIGACFIDPPVGSLDKAADVPLP